MSANHATLLRAGEAERLPALLSGRELPTSGQSFAGRLESGREARVTFHGGLWGPDSTIELAAPRAPRVAIRRRGGALLSWLRASRELDFDGFAVTSPDADLARRALAERSGLRPAIRGVFEHLGVERLVLWQGKLTATLSRRLYPNELRPLVARLEAIAAAFETVAIPVRVLGGERRVLRGFGDGPRCACCHDAITGEESDLVACRTCQTVLHESCWQDLGRCPVLGCGGREPERPRSSSGPVGEVRRP